MPGCRARFIPVPLASRLEFANIVDDRFQLCVVEGGSEGGHLARLAVPDARDDLAVGKLRTRELRPLARLAPALQVAPAASRREQLVHVEVCVSARLHWARFVGHLRPDARTKAEQTEQHCALAEHQKLQRGDAMCLSVCLT